MTHRLAHIIGGNSFTMVHTIYKGQVNVEVCGKSYRIRFTHHGVRKAFGTGIKVVDKSSEVGAIAIAKQIEADMYKGIFDESLERYKPEASKKAVLSLLQHFDFFLIAKEAEIRPYTFEARYLAHRKFCENILGSFPSLEDFTTNFCVARMTALKATLKWNTLKCKVTPLILFWDWMQADVDVPVNPWRKALKRFKVDEIEKPKPFSANEREQILNAMLFNQSLKPWLPVTRFLMTTGCRPGEAFALTFKDINQLDGYLTISKSAVQRNVGKTKTNKVRKVPLSENIRVALEEAVGNRDMGDDDLCFPHPINGSMLTTGIYLQYWKKALKLAGVPYRKPYANRHTFITEALLQGGNPAEVAKIAGNSPKVIYQHYLNVTGDISRSMPDI